MDINEIEISRDNILRDFWDYSPISDEEREEGNKVLECIAKTLDEINDGQKICKVKKFTFRHRDTNTDETVTDLWCYTAGSEVHQDIYAVMGVQIYDKNNETKCSKLYRSHVDLDHDNVAGVSCYAISTGETYVRLWYCRLCMPIKGNILHTSNVAGCLIAGQLSGTNPNSAYRHKGNFKTTAEGDEEFLKNNDGSQLKRNAGLVKLLTRLTDYDLTPQNFLSTTTQEKIIQEKTKLDEAIANNKQYLAKPKLDRYGYYTQEEIDEMKNNNTLSEYYRVFKIQKAIEELKELKPPVVEYDLVCCGLGSAGTGILDQFVRLTHFNKLRLIDFDQVEKKNLRNQWYTEGNIGDYKTNASRNKLRAVRPDLSIDTCTKRWEESYLEYTKGKYIISGFDSIKCRLELFDFIQEKNLDYKYWIDTRYEGQEASVWFVDLSNEEEKQYYRKRLLIDQEVLEENTTPPYWNLDNTREILTAKRIYTQDCATYMRKLFRGAFLCHSSCSSGECTSHWMGLLNKYNIKPEDFDNPNFVPSGIETNTCLAQNLIAIYKVASSFVTVAVNNIESGLPKGFIHIEVTTDGEINFRKMR